MEIGENSQFNQNQEERPSISAAYIANQDLAKT
jgi:hypothetical protein